MFAPQKFLDDGRKLAVWFSTKIGRKSLINLSIFSTFLSPNWWIYVFSKHKCSPIHPGILVRRTHAWEPPPQRIYQNNKCRQLMAEKQETQVLRSFRQHFTNVLQKYPKWHDLQINHITSKISQRNTREKFIRIRFSNTKLTSERIGLLWEHMKPSSAIPWYGRKCLHGCFVPCNVISFIQKKKEKYFYLPNRFFSNKVRSRR